MLGPPWNDGPISFARQIVVLDAADIEATASLPWEAWRAQLDG